MQKVTRLFSVALCYAFCCGAVLAADRWPISGGFTSIDFDQATLAEMGLSIRTQNQDGTTSIKLMLATEGVAGLSVSGPTADSIAGRLPMLGGFTIVGANDTVVIGSPLLQVSTGSTGVPLGISDAEISPDVALLEIMAVRQAFDGVAGVFLFESYSVRISPALAERLGNPSHSDQVVATVFGRLDGKPLNFPIASTTGTTGVADSAQDIGDGIGTVAGGNNGTVCPRGTGPDVIVGDLPDISNFAAVGQIESFSFGTTSCNVGNQNLLWISNTNQHPVIGQNMFRLKDGRFEQIGQAWLKHGFLALTENVCGCGCSGQGGSVLGVGCSDPYVSSLNGQQSGMGPKYQVNGFTGAYTYPFSHGDQGATGNGIYKRIQVAISDLEAVTAASSTQYFFEGQYVTPDDSSSGNNFNSVSYRRINQITGTGTNWTPQFSFAFQTQREKPAIRAWKIADPTVRETDIQVPNEGLFILSTKVSDLGTGFWHYEYAVYNMNSDRAAGAFSIPLASNVTVENIGFRDVPYHSGEPFSGTDWTPTVGGGSITWTTTPHATNANANAIRWGTLYNFRFDANVPPQNVVATIGLFKPGSPSAITAVTDGPGSTPDCDNNGIPDNCDLSCGSPGGPCDVAGCGTAADCNSNDTPDVCEPDCNVNTVADACDISNGTSRDCNDNGVPDECESLPELPLAAALVASGFTQPVYVTAPPGDSTRLFVVEQGGRIKIINRLNNTVLPTPFLNISGLLTIGGERGLLSMAFDPDYATNGFFFVNYTNTTAPGDTVIARYTVSADPNVANAASAVILKTIDQDFSNHKGGQLQFGPDGMLYVGMGDGGSADDPNGRGQNTGTLLGKMLRLDPDNSPTYVPADNPFVGAGNPLDEIWAIGMRNPWRFSFDRLTGDMWIGDVGQDSAEEIDFEPANSPGGQNYGWRCMEGNLCTGLSGCTCNGPTLTLPVHQYLHNVPGAPCYSLTGGYVYRGCQLPQLSGTYFYADYCLDRIWSFRYSGGSVTDFTERTVALSTPTGAISSPVSFGEDSDGELYIVSHQGGSIYRIVPGGGNPTCGNGVPEPGEECDDGNVIPGDGCDNACQSENGTDVCNDAPLICPGTYGGSTTSMLANGSSTCGISNKSPDVWYRYVPGTDGTLTVSLCGTSTYDTVVSVHAGCPGNAANEVGCDDDMCGNTRSLLSVPVTRAVDYYIRVSGYDTASGDFTLSLSGPACLQCPDILFEDHFGTDLGWTVTSVDLTDGAWQRGDPADNGVDGDPMDDYDGGGQCFLTDNTGGNSDVDGGPTYLISPIMELSTGNVSLSYAYWFMRDDADGDDSLSVSVSVDGGTNWTPMVTYSTGLAQWRTDSLLVDSFATPTATTRFRFAVKDIPNNSVVEAALDAVVLSRPCFADCNGNGISDVVDLSSGTSLDCNGNSAPDECDIESGTSVDCDGGPVGLIDGGGLIVEGNCFACHGNDGAGGPGLPGPSLRNHSRVEIWNKLLPPTNHPGGAHPEFTQQDFADLEAFFSDGGSRGRPDNVPDECQALTNCNGAPPSDGCELENGSQVDTNHDGAPDDCVTPVCNTLAGDAVGSRYLQLSAGPGTGRFAIRVDGEPGEPGVYCFSSYVQADGSLGLTPVLKTAVEWGEVLVTDSEIRPSTEYRSFAECASAASALVHLETWPWGSSEPTGIVDITDVLCVLLAYSGNYSVCSFEAASMWPCVPDSLIDLGEVTSVLEAYAGTAFSCAAPCP